MVACGLTLSCLVSEITETTCKTKWFFTDFRKLAVSFDKSPQQRCQDYSSGVVLSTQSVKAKSVQLSYVRRIAPVHVQRRFDGVSYHVERRVMAQVD